MHSRIIYGIVVAIVGMMIGRGIVLAFGLDRWVAQVIQTVTSWPTAEAVGWLLAVHSAYWGWRCGKRFR